MKTYGGVKVEHRILYFGTRWCSVSFTLRPLYSYAKSPVWALSRRDTFLVVI
jgi:hypothetical protein